jgi:F-type H+-transporting ATPase subunit b
MQLSWSTFLLEIVNFLVLVWILTHFLYRPVLAVIVRRREAIERQIADASAAKTEAETLQKRYQGRIDEWNAERRRALEALNRELDETRAARLADLQKALDAERKKAQAADAEREADAHRLAEQAAFAQAARFAARLLGPAAGRETETKLVDLAIAELSALPAERAEEIRAAEPALRGTAPASVRTAPASSGTAVVSSAFELPDTQRERIASALETLLGVRPGLEFLVDPNLMAGLRVTVGPWVLGLNLRDELAGFARLANER